MGSIPTRVLRTHLHSNQDETNAREEKTTGFGSPRIGTASEQGLVRALGSREEYTVLLKSKPEKETQG
ncbi:hypothetical protein J0J30_22750, partial [Vibrio vulnificus]|nr:hypothetical protein [Vibrio vulnificus]